VRLVVSPCVDIHHSKIVSAFFVYSWTRRNLRTTEFTPFEWEVNLQRQLSARTMYTPTPGTRRPRPPGSLARRNQPGKAASRNNMNVIEEGGTRTALTAYAKGRPLTAEEGYSSDGTSDRRQHPRLRSRKSSLVKISAGPANTAKTQSQDRPIGLGLPVSLLSKSRSSIESAGESLAPRPSPPPPYGLGPGLPISDDPRQRREQDDHHTPPQPDSGAHSHRCSRSQSVSIPDGARVALAPSGLDLDTGDTSEENAGSGRQGRRADDARAEEVLRTKRAKEAARAIGLDLQSIGTGSDTTGSGILSSDGEQSDDEEAIREKLRAARRELKARNNGEHRIPLPT
jgi:hypothetical protein